MRETRPSGLEGGGTGLIRSSLPLSWMEQEQVTLVRRLVGKPRRQ